MLVSILFVFCDDAFLHRRSKHAIERGVWGEEDTKQHFNDINHFWWLRNIPTSQATRRGSLGYYLPVLCCLMSAYIRYASLWRSRLKSCHRLFFTSLCSILQVVVRSSIQWIACWWVKSWWKKEGYWPLIMKTFQMLHGWDEERTNSLTLSNGNQSRPMLISMLLDSVIKQIVTPINLHKNHCKTPKPVPYLTWSARWWLVGASVLTHSGAANAHVSGCIVKMQMYFTFVVPH